MSARVPNTQAQNDASKRILIVAGGTGGHIAPALGVAQALRRRGESITVRMVTGSRPIEREAFAAAHEFPDHLACSESPSLSLRGVPGLVEYTRSFAQARALLRSFRPHAILATGGYVCAPVLAAARTMAIPYFLHESNAIPGRVVRLFARGSAGVFIAHEAAALHFHPGAPAHLVGTPVREELFRVSRPHARAFFGLDPETPTLLVLGGSQGARAINDSMLDALAVLAQREVVPQILWACGPLNAASVNAQLERLSITGLRVSVHPFLKEMAHAYAAADLVLSRAGASTLAEITALGLPSILIPYPHAADNHQRANAQSLARAGAALVVEENRLTGGSLALLISDLIELPGQRNTMARAAQRLGVPDSADLIARRLIGANPSPDMMPHTFPAHRPISQPASSARMIA